MRIAVLSDTHGLLRPEVLPLLEGADRILHAGDVGKAEILDQLGRIAPTHAIRGNVDHGALGASLPPRLTLDLDGRKVFMLHDLAELDFDPAEEGIDLVIFGHSHKPDYHERAGVRYLNPGSIGPRRFTLPISLVWVDWSASGFAHRFIELPPK